MRWRIQPLGPLGDQARELAGLGEVRAERVVLAHPCRPEKDDGVVEAPLPEDMEWLEVF